MFSGLQSQNKKEELSAEGGLQVSDAFSLVFRHRLILLVSTLLLSALLGPLKDAVAEAPPKVSRVEVYRAHSGHLRPIPATRLIHVEVERVLEGIHQMAGASLRQMPNEYFLFRFPTPVVLSDSPVGYPIREIALTMPRSAWDSPRLLIRNGQNHWVEYRTTRPLTVLLDQLKEHRL